MARRMTVAAIAAFAAVAQACLASAQSPPSPSPAATTLPYIGGTRAGRLCAVVRDSVAPAVVGLINADQYIVQSQSTYDAMANTPGDNERQTLHRIALGKIVVGLAHNLQVVQGVLMDSKRFPDPPKSDDDRLALKLREELRATAAQQTDALNMVNGVLETDLMRKMMGMFPHTPQPPINRAFYAKVALAIGEHRETIAKTETALSATVIEATNSCTSATPPP